MGSRNKRSPELLQGQLSINEDSDQAAVNTGNGASLGDRKYTAKNASENDYGSCQRSNGRCKGCSNSSHAAPCSLGIPPAHTDDPHHAHQQQAHENAWNDAANEHVAHRGFNQNGVNDHWNRGWNDGPHHSSRFTKGSRKSGWKSRSLHGRDHHRAGGRGIGDGRARDTRDDHAGKHRDMPQSSTDVTYQSGCKIHNATRDTARIHQLTSEEKKCDGNQWKAVNSIDNMLGHQFQGQMRPEYHQCCKTGAQDGKCQRDSEQTEEHETAEEDCKCHVRPVSVRQCATTVASERSNHAKPARKSERYIQLTEIPKAM